MSDKNFLDLQPGDVVVAYDIYSHDYLPYKIKIDCVEKDEYFVTETNPKGIHYHGDCLNPDGDEYITNVDEENFEEFLYHSVITEITPMFDGCSFKLGSGFNGDREYDIMVDIPKPGDKKFCFYLMYYEDECTKWDLTEEEKNRVKEEIGAYLWNELEDIPFDKNDCLDSSDGKWMSFKNGTKKEDIWHWFEDTFDKNDDFEMEYSG